MHYQDAGCRQPLCLRSNDGFWPLPLGVSAVIAAVPESAHLRINQRQTHVPAKNSTARPGKLFGNASSLAMLFTINFTRSARFSPALARDWQQMYFGLLLVGRRDDARPGGFFVAVGGESDLLH